MGFLDRILGKRRESAEGPKIQKLQVRLEDAEDAIQRELDLRMGPFYSDADMKIEGIMRLLAEVREIARAFANKPIKTENPQHEKIAKQMRDNFSKRIPKLLDDVKRPVKRDFEGVIKFHKDALKALQQLSKITYDNRYLPFFFKEEFEKLGGPVRNLAKAIEELGKGIEGSKKDYENANKYRSEIKRIDAERKRMPVEEGRVSERLKAAEALVIQTDERERNKGEIEKIERESAGLHIEESKLRGEVASLVLPLERVLRKYERISLNKSHSAIVREVLRDHLDLLRGDGRKGFMEICKELKEMLEEGKLQEDEKDKGKHLAVLRGIDDGRIDELILKLEEIERKIDAEEEGKKQLRKKIDSEEQREREKTEKIDKIKREMAEITEAKGKSEYDLKLLEKELGEWMKKEFKIIN